MNIEQIEHEIMTSLANDRVDVALHKVKDTVISILGNAQFTGQVFGSILLDELCNKIGEHVVKKMPPLKPIIAEDQPVIYLITELGSGGHTAMIKEFVEMQSTKKHHLIVSNLNNNQDRNDLRNLFASFSNVEFTWLKQGSLEEKLKELILKLSSLRYSKILLFNHHYDSVLIAAVAALKLENVYFFHHADHNMTLGLYVPFVKHVDLHSYGFHTCRCKLGIKDNIFMPLVSKDLKNIKKEFLKRNSLTTATAGAAVKFETPYKYPYSEIIVKVLEKTKGYHIHIGPLSVKTLETIRENLKLHNIDSTKFIHVPWVTSVSKALIEYDVDLFLTSFPFIGLKSTIEAMNAGIPVVTHENYFSQLLGGHFFVYKESYCWKKKEDLVLFFEGVDESFLKEQSSFSRNYYLKHHQEDLIKSEINLSIIKGLPVLELPFFRKDDLQMALDQLKIYEKMQQNWQYHLDVSLQKQQQEFENKFFWKITKPLRFIVDKIKKGF